MINLYIALQKESNNQNWKSKRSFFFFSRERK